MQAIDALKDQRTENIQFVHVKKGQRHMIQEPFLDLAGQEIEFLPLSLPERD